MSGASREFSSTEGSTFFAAAKAAALSRIPESAGNICSNTGMEARYIEMAMGRFPEN
jgi:hypothetical protein